MRVDLTKDLTPSQLDKMTAESINILSSINSIRLRDFLNICQVCDFYEIWLLKKWKPEYEYKVPSRGNILKYRFYDYKYGLIKTKSDLVNYNESENEDNEKDSKDKMESNLEEIFENEDSDAAYKEFLEKIDSFKIKELTEEELTALIIRNFENGDKFDADYVEKQPRGRKVLQTKTVKAKMKNNGNIVVKYFEVSDEDIGNETIMTTLSVYCIVE